MASMTILNGCFNSWNVVSSASSVLNTHPLSVTPCADVSPSSSTVASGAAAAALSSSGTSLPESSLICASTCARTFCSALVAGGAARFVPRDDSASAIAAMPVLSTLFTDVTYMY